MQHIHLERTPDPVARQVFQTGCNDKLVKAGMPWPFRGKPPTFFLVCDLHRSCNSFVRWPGDRNTFLEEGVIECSLNENERTVLLDRLYIPDKTGVKLKDVAKVEIVKGEDKK